MLRCVRVQPGAKFSANNQRISKPCHAQGATKRDASERHAHLLRRTGPFLKRCCQRNYSSAERRTGGTAFSRRTSSALSRAGEMTFFSKAASRVSALLYSSNGSAQ